ncbi:MAG: hypothetical protein Q8Q14_01735 [Gemmatimonadales bacterium]|nr:hypothetical protein [Gemmatimonadales bacterium]
MTFAAQLDLGVVPRCIAERAGLRCDLPPHAAGVHLARPAAGEAAVSWPTEAHAALERAADEMRALGLRCQVGADGEGRACLSAWVPPARSAEDLMLVVAVEGAPERTRCACGRDDVLGPATGRCAACWLLLAWPFGLCRWGTEAEHRRLWRRRRFFPSRLSGRDVATMLRHGWRVALAPDRLPEDPEPWVAFVEPRAERARERPGESCR